MWPQFAAQSHFLLSGTQGRTRVEASPMIDGSSSHAQLQTSGRHSWEAAQYPLNSSYYYCCVFKVMVGCLIYPKGVRVSERRPIESAYLCLPKKKIIYRVSSPGEHLCTWKHKNEGGGVSLLPHSKNANTHGISRFSPLGHLFCAFASILSVFGHSIQVSALPFGFQLSIDTFYALNGT